jgi:hypothetical protein
MSSGASGLEERDDPIDFAVESLSVPGSGSELRACGVFAQTFQPTDGGGLAAQPGDSAGTL